ncbi:cyclin-dependent kinase 12 [Helicoverpa armigera]|uniref:cyclin-dependent kinase 12 n=1 Tax=Helicoverpa armigera TaxID=29058 RepID=UPI003083D54F
MKMREFMRITFVCVCAFLLAVRETRCEDEVSDDEAGSLRNEENDQRRDSKGPIPGGGRRTTTQSSANATRDSQLLSLLAARRRQLLNERLATHINTLSSLAHKANKSNTTFAQLEVRDSNSSTVKRITFDNSSNEPAPTIKLVASDGSKEIRQEVKPHEIRHIFVPRVFQDNKSRGGFINNRRREGINKSVTIPERVEVTASSIVYVPPEKFENLDKDIELDPEEEFQVDESNHGLYLLNYSDPENVTQNTNINGSVSDAKDNSTKVETTTQTSEISKEETSVKTIQTESEEKSETNVIANSTDSKSTKLVKVENEKENRTLFMTDEIYNHFRPLETELPVEEMAPFKYFGQKLGGQAISDNLTNSPTLSASTKSVNFIVAPLEKRKFNSRYSATEKYKNTSVDEEEINEDMDVSVVKNFIEKNKIRNTVKGPAPARHVGLVNAYRKFSTTVPTTTKPQNVAQLNVTEPIIPYSTPSIIDKSKDGNKTNSTTTNNIPPKPTVNNSTRDSISNKTSVPAPRNFTRNYSNIRRRPLRVTAASTELTPVLTTLVINATTTEKASTSVYTAVVTSVSITSSMKGSNKTDGALKDEDNSTIADIPDTNNGTIPKAILINDTETITVPPTSFRPKHIIRIRTTTTENPNSSPVTASPVASELSSKNQTFVRNETESKISDRLASLFRQRNIENATNSTRTNKHRRRRPTTTTTTTTTTTPVPTLPPTEKTIESSVPTTQSTAAYSSAYTSTLAPATTPSFKTFVVTSRTSSESSSKPVFVPSTTNKSHKTVNRTDGEEIEDPSSQNEEVVIEAEKTYTASYVLAGLGFLPVAAIVAFVLRSILNKKTKEIDTEYEGYFEDGDIKKESPITPVARPPLPTPTKPDQKWEFPRNKLRLQTLLGQGNFGQVWKAEADDLNGHDGLTRLVAVKSIKETASQKEKQELLHEIYIMQKIGTHPNVVTLLACCTEQEPYLLIMEYVMCGKLLTYLRERRSRPDRFSGSGALTSRDLTVFAYCVARGMDYIASKGIVHRDLAARNVLVDHNKLCKIADFGMSRSAAAGAPARAPRAALPVRWMAPEALLYSVCSHHTDVWAFGILLWEIVTLGSTPYAAMSGREVLGAVTEGYRLERPPHCAPALYRAMHACWHADPAQRPTFAALKATLATLLHNEPSEGNYVDLDSFYQESSVYSDPSAIINDDEGLSAEYDRERRCFRELTTGPAKFENRAFNFRDEELRNKFGIGTPRMGGFGIRDVPFNDRNFSDGEFNERNFPKENFTDTNFTERKDGKLSTSSFHRERERERENPLVSRNSFNGFPRVGTRDRDNHFQMAPDGRNKRVSEFECDI